VKTLNLGITRRMPNGSSLANFVHAMWVQSDLHGSLRDAREALAAFVVELDLTRRLAGVVEILRLAA
jgi:hypothetical protein